MILEHKGRQRDDSLRCQTGSAVRQGSTQPIQQTFARYLVTILVYHTAEGQVSILGCHSLGQEGSDVAIWYHHGHLGGKRFYVIISCSKGAKD